MKKIEPFALVARTHTHLERILDAVSLGRPFLGRVLKMQQIQHLSGLIRIHRSQGQTTNMAAYIHEYNIPMT